MNVSKGKKFLLLTTFCCLLLLATFGIQGSAQSQTIIPGVDRDSDYIEINVNVGNVNDNFSIGTGNCLCLGDDPNCGDSSFCYNGSALIILVN